MFNGVICRPGVHSRTQLDQWLSGRHSDGFKDGRTTWLFLALAELVWWSHIEIEIEQRLRVDFLLQHSYRSSVNEVHLFATFSQMAGHSSVWQRKGERTGNMGHFYFCCSTKEQTSDLRWKLRQMWGTWNSELGKSRLDTRIFRSQSEI